MSYFIANYTLKWENAIFYYGFWKINICRHILENKNAHEVKYQSKN